MNKPSIGSLFCGVGGIDQGFANAGFHTAFATDNWDIACQSFSKNHPCSEVVQGDVADVSFKALKALGHVDGIVGGPPCPPFSKSRFYLKDKKRALEDASGLASVTHFFRAIREIRPKFFLLENVHGFVYKPHAAALQYVEEQSKELKYKLTYGVVNAADYGAPQIRQRFICVGLRGRGKRFEFPHPTHADPVLDNTTLPSWITCADAISDLDYPRPEDALMKAGSRDHYLLKKIPPGDNYLFYTKERGHRRPVFVWRSRYWSFLLKLSPDRPSWTIQASHSNNMGPFHWRNRFLRIEEIKRLQSFDDSTITTGSYREQWRLIGNAVPPRLAEVFAKAIREQVLR